MPPALLASPLHSARACIASASKIAIPALAMAGCTQPIGTDQIDIAQRLCETHNGIEWLMPSRTRQHVSVQCRDGSILEYRQPRSV